MEPSSDIYYFLKKIALRDISLFIVCIFIISFMVRGISHFSGWFAKNYPSKRMAVFEWVPIINFTLYFVGVFVSFHIIFEPSREFLSGFVVSIFFAIGFALKDVITSVIAGIILLIDKPFQIGDRVAFQEYYGEILEIGLRSVKLLTLDENVVTIPNNRFLVDSVSSSNVGELGMMTAVDLHVPGTADLYKIKEILHEEVKKSHYIDPKGKISIVGAEILGGDGKAYFVMTVKCIVKDVRLEKEFQTDFLFAVNKRFKTDVA
jgi:small conductance mechanosensitive channel